MAAPKGLISLRILVEPHTKPINDRISGKPRDVDSTHEPNVESTYERALEAGAVHEATGIGRVAPFWL
jgi:hypothetical protein